MAISAQLSHAIKVFLSLLLEYGHTGIVASAVLTLSRVYVTTITITAPYARPVKDARLAQWDLDGMMIRTAVFLAISIQSLTSVMASFLTALLTSAIIQKVVPSAPLGTLARNAMYNFQKITEYRMMAVEVTVTMATITMDQMDPKDQQAQQASLLPLDLSSGLFLDL